MENLNNIFEYMAEKTINNNSLDTTKLSNLERKILGENLIKCYSIMQLQHILPQLLPFVGVKISTLKGKSAKFKIDFQPFTFIGSLGLSYRVHFDLSDYSIWLVNDITLMDKKYESGGYGCSYYKQNIYLGDMKEGILTKLLSFEDIVKNSDLDKLADLDHVKELRENAKNLEAQISKIKSELSSLGIEYNSHY